MPRGGFARQRRCGRIRCTAGRSGSRSRLGPRCRRSRLLGPLQRPLLWLLLPRERRFRSGNGKGCGGWASTRAMFRRPRGCGCIAIAGRAGEHDPCRDHQGCSDNGGEPGDVNLLEPHTAPPEPNPVSRQGVNTLRESHPHGRETCHRSCWRRRSRRREATATPPRWTSLLQVAWLLSPQPIRGALLRDSCIRLTTALQGSP